ncbi:hypothetical protein [Paucimonas lemoignei]|uniref:hypothetical protein n=1 Tax=Paucimonas lemoignei TaxID=29443 RepID=UPI00105223EA|nr:hypothetical protein [Paucimonas lemoignei]
MTNTKQHSDPARNPQADKAAQHQGQEEISADEKSALDNPPVEQVNPDHKGLNPDHLGPAQPRQSKE